MYMGAWGCTLPSTAAASRTHRSPGRKKIRPLTGTPRMLSWRLEVAMILVYRRQGLRIRRDNGFMHCNRWNGDAQRWTIGVGAGGTTNAIACRLGNAGQLPGVLYVRAACRSRSDCVPRSVYSQLQQRRVWAGCAGAEGKPQAPGGNAPRGNAGRRQPTRANAGATPNAGNPRETRGLRLFPVWYLYYP